MMRLRGFGWFAIALVALCALWLVLVRGYADYLARIAPERAVELNPKQIEALSRLAERALQEGDLIAAEAFARRAVAAGFFEGRAIRVLGAIAETKGDVEAAQRLMQAAARARPRDTATQYWLALHALRNQDVDAAMERLDRVLRFEPALLNQVFPLLGTFASNPVGARAMLPYLSRSPYWRAPFFNQLLRQSTDPAVVIRLGKLLAGVGSPMTETETQALVDSLTAQRNWALLRSLGPPSTDGSLLRDGRFEGLSEGLLPAWRLQTVKGADIRIGPDLAGASPQLQVYFYDRRVPFRHVRQLLLLDPGSYLLSGRVRLNGLEGPQGLAWTIRCGTEHGSVLATTEKFHGTTDWREWQLAFDVPAQECGGQWLILEVPARIAAEQRLKGDAAFADLRIEPGVNESASLQITDPPDGP
jgi:tetratricopeptide (TPR) repeat protein